MKKAKMIEKLKAARNLIAQEGAWTQNASARDADGIPCTPVIDEAVCFCAVGAIRKTAGRTWWSEIAPPFYAALIQEREGENIVDWNDTPGRTQAEVVAMFDKAIEIAEAA